MKLKYFIFRNYEYNIFDSVRIFLSMSLLSMEKRRNKLAWEVDP